MKLYEFEGKSIFRKMGISTPRGYVVTNLEEAKEATNELGFPVVIKGQILRGGRGKAGGIRSVGNEEDLIRCVTEMIGMKCVGEKVEKLLIEEEISISHELYAGITLDPQFSLPLLMISTQGGEDIEYVANNFPNRLFTKPLDPLETQRPYHMIDMVLQTGLRGKVLLRVSRAILNLVDCYFRHEAITAEINPLIIDPEGNVLAVDAKLEIDDSAIDRVKELFDFGRIEDTLDPLEAEAKAEGVSYVRINRGNIGLIAGGAGLGMTSMDMISAHGGAPANFLDLGGDATPKKTAAALRIVLKTPGVEGVLINAFGGINNCEAMARGIIQIIKKLNPPQTIVVKIRGHSQEEGWALLEAKNIPIIKFGTTEEAIVLLLEKMEKNG